MVDYDGDAISSYSVRLRSGDKRSEIKKTNTPRRQDGKVGQNVIQLVGSSREERIFDEIDVDTGRMSIEISQQQKEPHNKFQAIIAFGRAQETSQAKKRDRKGQYEELGKTNYVQVTERLKQETDRKVRTKRHEKL